MKNVISGISSEIVYYFSNLNRVNLNDLIVANNNSVKHAAKSANVNVQIVVDTVSVANNVQFIAEDFNYNLGVLTLVFEYNGVTNSNKKRYYHDFNLNDAGPSFTTMGLFY